MQKNDLLCQKFRRISVHSENGDATSPFFRPISVHSKVGGHLFPVHIRSLCDEKSGKKRIDFPQYVHSLIIFSYLCTGFTFKNTSTMAGTIKAMNLIKQVLQLKELGESNRGIARKLPIDKETVNRYMQILSANGWEIPELLKVDDPELERMFHAGSPAYTDARMEEFLRLLPYFREQLSDRKNHVTRQLLWEEYRATHPGGYCKSQFYDHLKQNLVAQKDIATVLSDTYKPGEKLMVDFAGDKLSYTDPETGEIVKMEVFVGCMPYSDYIYAVCVPSQRTEDFLHAIRLCLEHLGGVPPILTPDNLKAAVIKSDRHEPTLNSALRDMGNHYHFTVLPCDPGEPTQKALVEDAVRITYNRIAAKLRGRAFHSPQELNQAVAEANCQLNQTRMQKRPYTREERFHAMEKTLLQPLPETVYEMRYYADLKVQQSCFVELRHEKVTHFYSVPYVFIGRKARVIFTRSWVRIYIDGKAVATHIRSHQYGHTYVEEHLASKSRAIVARSASYYISWASHVSKDCEAYIREVFSTKRTNQPEEVYYRLCAAILSSYRRHESACVDLTCRQCLENRVFSFKKFDAILKHNLMSRQEGEPSLFAPVPTDHANMRGTDYFK